MARTFFLIFLGIALICPANLFAAEELRMLVYEGYAPEKHLEAFRQIVKAKYGVDLNVKVKNISEMEDIYKSLKNKEADLITASNNLPNDPRYKYIQGKLTIPADLNNIPNFKDINPDLQKTPYFTDKGEVYGIPFCYGGYSLAYNTARVKEAPPSWNVFWDPKYAGKYVLSSSFYDANINITALAMGVAKDKIYDYDAVASPEFLEKLKLLVKNTGAFYEAIDDADTLQGKSLAACWGFSFSELAKRGEIWKAAFPKEGTPGYVDGWLMSHALADNPKLKRIAEEWLNYVIGPDFQTEQVVRTLGVFPVSFAIRDRLTPEETEAFHLNDPNFFKDNFVLWEILDKRTREGFKLFWKKAGR